MRHYYYLPYVFGAVNLFLIGILALILLAISVMDLLGRWKVYKKAGEPGWKAFVPLYREYTLFHLAWADKYFWLWLGLLVAVQLSRGSKGLFGILGGLLALVFGIALAAVTWVSRRRLAAAFGKDKNFAAGLFLLGPVFMLMLGCSSAKYLGPDPAPIEETIPVIKPYMEKIERQLKQ